MLEVITLAFSNFKTVEQVLQSYPLKLLRERFLANTPMELPDWFLENLNFALDKQVEGENEIFFRESFIFPMLQQVWKQHQAIKIWAHRMLRYDDVLNGEPDYFVSRWPDTVTDRLVISPLLAVIEAKRQDFEEGWGQCLAAMLACQKLNAAEDVTVYGIVSTGLVWEFGKLSGSCFSKDPLAHSLENPQNVAGLLDSLFTACEKQIQAVQQEPKESA